MYFVYHELYIKLYRHWVLKYVLLEILNLNLLFVYKCSINSKTKYWIRVIFQTKDPRLWRSSQYHSPLLTCLSLVFALKASYGSFNPDLNLHWLLIYDIASGAKNWKLMEIKDLQVFNCQSLIILTVSF